jgi:hypothetical protein
LGRDRYADTDTDMETDTDMSADTYRERHSDRA